MPDPLTPDTLTPDPPAPARVRLEYLDGVRGLAALYVVLHHAYMQIGWRGDGGGLPRPLVHATNWLLFGQASVDVFIVLSGYVLMLPVARSAGLSLPRGAADYFRRRFRRIVPPYWAALGLSWALVALVPGLRHASGAQWDVALPAFGLRNIALHLALLHNLSPQTIHKIDYPLWSVATEWQIYFLFPLVLLPAWRRGGWPAAVAAGFALGCALLGLFHDRLWMAAPQFIGLFALGMAAAGGGSSGGGGGRRLPAGPLALACAGVFCLLAEFRSRQIFADYLLMDIPLGAATAFLLVFLASSAGRPQGERSPLLRLLGSRPAVALGAFSYSLYLIHAPLLALAALGVRHAGLTPTASLAALLGLGVPACVAASYLFHLAFERPFMPGRPRTERGAEAAAALSPAP